MMRLRLLLLTGLSLLSPISDAGLVVQSGPRHFTESGSAPTYTPLMAWSAAGGTLGNPITGWVFNMGNRMTYGNDVAGPFGGSRIGVQSLLAGNNFYGGTIIDSLSAQDIANGDDIWIRMYHWFPAGFCFSSGTVSGDRWGNVKWYRIEFTNSARLTNQLGDLGGDAVADSPTCGTQAGWGGFTSEYGGDQNKIISSPALQVTRGAWLALQVHVRLSTSASTGYVESWINDTYLGRAVDQIGGENTYLTMPATGQPISFIVFGDYWNGGPYVDQEFYFDELIITTQTPNTVDAGGRPYISPTTRVADFP